jgi:hypothetical protein
MDDELVEEKQMEDGRPPEWIDVPAHRVLKVTDAQLWHDFTLVDENGVEMSKEGVRTVYRIVRNKDRKMFCMPRFHRTEEDFGKFFFLEEV